MRPSKVLYRHGVIAGLFLLIVLAGCVPSTSAPVQENRSQRETPTVLPAKTPSASSTATSPPTTNTTKEKPTATATILPTETMLPAAGQDDSSSLNSEDAAEEIVIGYKRSGGFAGLDEEFTIYTNGRITSKDGSQWWVEPAEVDLLLDELEALGFFDLAPKYIPKNPCCDLFFYELSVISSDQNATVSTVDGAPGAPDQLWKMLDLVQNFLNQAVSR